MTIDVYNFIMRGSGEGGAYLFSLMSGNGLKLHQGKFRLDIRKKLLTHRVVKHWNKLLREAVMAPSLSVFKKCLGNSLRYTGWRLNHFPGQPVPMLENPFSEEKFPNTQSKPPLVQLETISSCPITCYLGEETDPHLSTTSFQVVVEGDKVSPQPPFLQAKQPQLPQLLLIRPVLYMLHQLFCSSFDTLQHFNVLLVVRGPKPNTVFEVQPHQCRVQGYDHFPSPAGHAIFDTSQDAIGLLGHLGTLLAHIQVAVNQHAQVLLCQAAFQPLFPKPVALHGVAVAQVQDLALGLVKPHTIDLGPSIQPVQVPLQSLPTLKQINTPTQLGVVCKLTEGALDPFIQIIDKDVKQNWPQHRALGNTACDRPPTGVNSIHHHSLGLAIQPVLYPAKSTPVQAMSSQFLQENAVGNHVKGFTEVYIDNIHSLSLIHQVGHLLIEGDQVGQAGPAFPEPMLAGPDPLVILYMPCDSTQDDLLHQLPWHRAGYQLLYPHLGIRKRFLTERVVGHWNRLPREVVMAPSLSEFKEHLDDALSHMV
ncbi:hypothetical protein QYF61_000231 [Mycteria americana]|uniref:Uncharacterized protein n=1 Tax=Mycteria americana TaxID=33587 RepID=A0AAN7RWK1_MYCAM|nr:hypothetical protein QYF61_000231 [Mycteria americana]